MTLESSLLGYHNLPDADPNIKLEERWGEKKGEGSIRKSPVLKSLADGGLQSPR